MAKQIQTVSLLICLKFHILSFLGTQTQTAATMYFTILSSYQCPSLSDSHTMTNAPRLRIFRGFTCCASSLDALSWITERPILEGNDWSEKKLPSVCPLLNLPSAFPLATTNLVLQPRCSLVDEALWTTEPAPSPHEALARLECKTLRSGNLKGFDK